MTFRGKHLKGTSTKELAQNVVKAELEQSGKISKVRVKKLFQTYAVLELGELSELKVAAELLSKRPEVLATEWLQRKRLFGI